VGRRPEEARATRVRVAGARELTLPCLTNPFAPSLFDYQLAPPSNVRVKPTENQRRLVELSERCVESEPKSTFTRQPSSRTEPRNGADAENVEHREQQDEAKAVDALVDR
jgi:hypothetical protein